MSFNLWLLGDQKCLLHLLFCSICALLAGINTHPPRRRRSPWDNDLRRNALRGLCLHSKGTDAPYGKCFEHPMLVIDPSAVTRAMESDSSTPNDWPLTGGGHVLKIRHGRRDSYVNIFCKAVWIYPRMSGVHALYRSRSVTALADNMRPVEREGKRRVI